MKVTDARNQVLFGAAYYDEYMPTDRIDQDVAMETIKQWGEKVIPHFR